jgi:hypothetical protein
LIGTLLLRRNAESTIARYTTLEESVLAAGKLDKLNGLCLI